MWAAVLVSLAAVCGASVFDAELRGFVESHGVASAHCGVAFDVTTGLATSTPLFAQPRFQIDPFVGGVDQRVEEVREGRFFPDVFLPTHARQVTTLGHLFEAIAREHRLEYVPGMFCKSALPYFAPEHEHDGGGHGTFTGYRSHEMLSMVVEAASTARLHPELEAALRLLPHFYDPGYAVLWEQFFDRFKTHWVEAAVVGGKLAFSARLLSAGAGLGLQQALEDKLLLLAASDEGGAPVRALAGHAMTDRLTHVGGDGSLLPMSIAHLNATQFGAWLASVRQNPAIVRYRLRSISDLVPDSVEKRMAVRQAADAYLASVHALWRNEHMVRFHSGGLEQEHQQHLRGEIHSLAQQKTRLERDVALLEEQLEQTAFCEERKARSTQFLSQCQIERRAYQKSVVECETRGLGLEETELKVQACELQLLSCKMPRRPEKTVPAPERVAAAEGRPAAGTEATAAAAAAAEEEQTVPVRVAPRTQAKATKDPLFDETSLVSRFVGLLLVLGLAGGIIVCMLRS